MGQVFLAERLQIGGRVALKVLHANFANHPEMAARFFNEARAANSVEHAGIVKVYEYGRLPDGGAFIAMEFVDGPSLRHRLTEQRKLSPQTASRLARQMATALAAAHARGVVHRDLKPDKITPIGKWQSFFRRPSEKAAEVFVPHLCRTTLSERISNQAH